MTIKELYEEIGGDYADVLNRLPSDAFIAKFLKKYVESNEFNQMIQAYESKDYSTLFMTSHSLKGMSGNMSLTPIQKVVSEICEAVRHGAPAIDLSPLIIEAKELQLKLTTLVNQL